MAYEGYNGSLTAVCVREREREREREKEREKERKNRDILVKNI
jgi:hypothetical protein